MNYNQKLLERYVVTRYLELFGNVGVNPKEIQITQCLEQPLEESRHTLGLVLVAALFASFILALLVLCFTSL
jgi:uncharacterized protein involved in exopolysaccharide biosynthesis